MDYMMNETNKGNRMKIVKAVMDRRTNKWSIDVEGKRIRSTKRTYVAAKAAALGYAVSFGDESNEEAQVESKFAINTRFDFVTKLVKMVASGVQASAIITGEGGLGKTFTVTKTLDEAGYTDISDLSALKEGTIVRKSKCYTMVKGYSTPKGLYRTLFENNGSIIVFDDCDSVLKDPVALNLLKTALDSYGKRIISWNADFRDEDLPRSFSFTGRVIFISNLNQFQIDQAIRSRSMMIDLSMNTDQKLERMEYIVKQNDFMPEFEVKEKLDAINYIKEIKDEVKEISLRTLISVTKIRSANTDWKDLARYILVA